MLTYYLILTAIHSLLLFAVALILRHWRRESAAFRWLLALLLFSFVCDAISVANFLFKLKIESNLFSNLHTMFNPFLIGLFFFQLLKGRTLQYTLIILLIGNFIFSANLSLSTPAWSSFNTLTESFLILWLSLLWYFRILKEPPGYHIQHMPEFWVVTGFFLSTSGKLIVYTVSTYLLDVLHDNLVVLQIIHNLLSVLGNALIGYGVFIQHKQFGHRERVTSMLGSQI